MMILVMFRVTIGNGALSDAVGHSVADHGAILLVTMSGRNSWLGAPRSSGVRVDPEVGE